MRTAPVHDYRAFYRPATLFNAIVNVLAAGPRRTASYDDIRRWRASSLSTLRDMGAREDVLTRIETEGEWRLTESRAPRDVWCGELKLPASGEGAPIITFYLDSVWTRAPTRRLFELLSQIGVDHMVGHLYPYYAGDADFDEEVACRYQYLMLRARPDRASWASALVLPILHYLHKRIPLSNYR